MLNQKHNKEAESSQTTERILPPGVQKKYRFLLWVGLICDLAAFIILTVYVRSTGYSSIDLQITRALQGFKPPYFAMTMSLVSWMGFWPQSVLITVLIAGVFYWMDLRWEALVGIGAALFNALLNTLVKIAIHRVRPAPDLVHVVAVLKSYSFPSGHVMFYAGFFGFAWFVFYTRFKKSGLRLLLLFALGALILSVGVSRVYLGEHWPSDVMGGYLLSVLTLSLTIWVYQWGQGRFFTHQQSTQDETKPMSGNDVQ